MPDRTRTITVQQYLEDKWARRSDVDSFLMRSQIKSGSRVWKIADVLPGYPLNPDAIYPTIAWFDFTDDQGKRRRSRWPVDSETLITVVFRLPVGAGRPA